MIKIGQMNHWVLLSIDLEESIGLLASLYTHINCRPMKLGERDITQVISGNNIFTTRFTAHMRIID